MNEPRPGEGEGPLPEAGALEVRHLLLSSIVALAALVGGVSVVVSTFREEVNTIGQTFVDAMGGFGVLLGFYIPDACTVPLPNDVFAAFGLIGGMPFWEIVFWGTIGSYLGGATGYLGGRFLVSRSHRLSAFLQRRGVRELERYGAWALLAAALTPLPYSVFCWASGAIRMPVHVFVGISSLRFFRVAGYLWLIQLGIVSVLD